MDKVRKKGCKSIQRAFETFGHQCIRSFIIARAPEGTKTGLVKGDTNDLEMFFIGPAGLDTMSPKGHNLVTGGGSGKPSDATRATMSESQTQRWAAVLADPEAAAAASEAVKKARAELLADSERAAQWKGRLSKNTKTYMEKVANDAVLRTDWMQKHKIGQDKVRGDPALNAAMIAKAKTTRVASQLLKDAKKWISLLAECSNDSQCRALLAKYEKVVHERKLLNDRVARRKSEGVVRKDKRVRKWVV